MIILALYRCYCLNSQFRFCCSDEISKFIPHCQVWAAAGNEAYSLQVTEVSGTNVTSKRVTAPFVCSTLCMLRGCTAKNSWDRCFPRRRNFLSSNVYEGVCVLLGRSWNRRDPSFNEWVAKHRKLLIFLFIYLIQRLYTILKIRFSGFLR